MVYCKCGVVEMRCDIIHCCDILYNEILLAIYSYPFSGIGSSAARPAPGIESCSVFIVFILVIVNPFIHCSQLQLFIIYLLI
jgi:hypothetical protein